jgi:hypothetical protein
MNVSKWKQAGVDSMQMSNRNYSGCETAVSMENAYCDIMDMEWPRPSDRVRMSVADRAKIFAPFAALRGHESAIVERQRILVPKIELSDESKQVLDLKMQVIRDCLEKGEHPFITVINFEKDPSSEEGVYVKFTGLLAKLEETSKILQVVDKRIKIEDIVDLQGEMFVGVEL